MKFLPIIITTCIFGALFLQSANFGKENASAGMIITSNNQIERETGGVLSTITKNDRFSTHDILRFNSNAKLTWHNTTIYVEKTSELQILGSKKAPQIHLFTGRILTDGPVTVETPWTTSSNSGQLSVVHAAHKQHVQIFPITASTLVGEINSGEFFETDFPVEYYSKRNEWNKWNKPYPIKEATQGGFYLWATENEFKVN